MRTKIITLIMIMFIIPVFAFAGEVTLQWVPPDEGTPIQYKIYQRTGETFNTTPIWEGEGFTCKVQEPEIGVEYAYVATAVYKGQISGEIKESEYSNEVTHFSVGGPPKTLIIQGLEQISKGLESIHDGISKIKIGIEQG